MSHSKTALVEEIASQMEVGAEMTYAYMTLPSGEIQRVHEFDADSAHRKLADQGAEIIPNLPSQDLYLWMVEFAAGTPESVRPKLQEALSGVAAVWKFRNIMYHNDALSLEWDEFKRRKLLETAQDWFRQIG